MSTYKVSVFSTDSVTMFRGFDFYTEDRFPSIKYKECLIILFYNEDELSRKLIPIWTKAGSEMRGMFCACNIAYETQILSNFRELSRRNDHYSQFAVKEIPFILVYREGDPVGFYNGKRDVKSIVQFSLTKARERSWFEPIQKKHHDVKDLNKLDNKESGKLRDNSGTDRCGHDSKYQKDYHRPRVFVPAVPISDDEEDQDYDKSTDRSNEGSEDEESNSLESEDLDDENNEAESNDEDEAGSGSDNDDEDSNGSQDDDQSKISSDEVDSGSDNEIDSNGNSDEEEEQNSNEDEDDRDSESSFSE